MAEKTTVAFRIDESTKEEWEKAAEDPEYQSLSHLIRLAVQREITEGSAPRTAEADTETTTDSEVLESLNRLERDIGEIQDEMKAVSRESQSEELFDLKQVLMEVLVTVPEDIVPDEDILPSSLGEKPRTVAGRIGADTSDVIEALEELDDNVGQIRSHSGYYWRIEQ